MSQIKILILLGTTREENRSQLVARAIYQKLKAKHIDTRLLTLAELNLPLFTKKNPDLASPFINIIKSHDGIVFITPEYNNSYPGVLKNTLDYLNRHLSKRVAGIIGVSSGRMGGVRAVMHLRDVLLRLDATLMPKTVYLSEVDDAFDLDENLVNTHHEKNINEFLDELIWHTEALKDKRDKEEKNAQ